MKKMTGVDTLAMWMVVVGALNWGLLGLLDLNLVSSVLGGEGSLLTKLVYILVGVSGAWMVWKWYGGKK